MSMDTISDNTSGCVITNAVIESVSIDDAERGLLTAWLTLDYPRVANTDDYDTFSVWAPCEAPPNAHSGLAQETIAEMVEAARIRALAKGAE